MFDAVASNRRRSIVMIMAFVLVMLAASWGFSTIVGGGPTGLVLALAFTGVSSFLAYWKSDAVALAMSHARPADAKEYARLHNLIEGLCIASGVPKPRLYVIEDDAPNAFATGRDPKHAAIAVTTGLLAKMNRVELEGVLAHELSHIKNRDILVSTLAVTMVGVIAVMADWSMRFLWWGGPRHRDDRNSNSNGAGQILAVLGVVLMVLTPIVAKLMQFAVSRKREALADMTAVSITRYPPGLISALEKLNTDHTVVHSGSKATAHLWIESPIARHQSEERPGQERKMAWLNRMFDTHPPLTDRIQALREL
jgi:heat shock protein HtpX